jgi:hypothetical protein
LQTFEPLFEDQRFHPSSVWNPQLLAGNNNGTVVQ